MNEVGTRDRVHYIIQYGIVFSKVYYTILYIT